MNKAAFLDILHHVSEISEQEVNELEKVIQNFPYCQTAHLLLAKAAYDQGSMLSNQKLRRAAACATNRQLFKKLIYTTQPEVVLTPITEIQHSISLEDNLSENNIYKSEDINQDNNIVLGENPKEELLIQHPELQNIAPVESNSEIEPVLPNQEIAEPELPIYISEDPLFLEEKITTAEDEQDDLFSVEHLAAVSSLSTEEIKEILKQIEDRDLTDILPQPELNDEPEKNIISEDINILIKNNSDDTVNAFVDPEEIELKATLTNFDAYLFSPEKEIITLPAVKPAYQEEIIYKVFDENDLGYWMESSRLGESLLVKSELTPPHPYYFHPELLLEYSRHSTLQIYQAPAPSPLSVQIDIIDQFLKLSPKLKTMSKTAIKPEIQEDLSSKSTKIKKDMASETLANILIQQGKIKKAIKIYEHLLLKIPEKKAYFASQIEKLQLLS